MSPGTASFCFHVKKLSRAQNVSLWAQLHRPACIGLRIIADAFDFSDCSVVIPALIKE
jgi:hypothetical protein